jgi:RNA polymerase sigma factor for flagellar operon FliA
MRGSGPYRPPPPRTDYGAGHPLAGGPERRAGEEESALWSRWRGCRDGAARAALIQQYEPLARRIAAAVFRRRPGNDVEFEDYRQFASVGLVEAVERFDPALGARFGTYAGPRIRGAVLSGLERMTERRRLAGTRKQLERERLASMLPDLGGLEGEALLERLGDLAVNVAFSIILDGLGLAPGTQKEGLAGPYAQLELHRTKRQIRAAVDRLPPRERLVIELHYHQERTLDEVARALEVSRPRACQLHKRALERLRDLVSKAESCDRNL